MMHLNSVAQAWSALFTPRDRRPIHEWAHDNVWLDPPFTRTGWFDVSESRHFIAILQALQDDSVREVNVLKPVRGGGTLIADVWIPWTRVNDPGPSVFLMQTDKIAAEHQEKCWRPILDKCPGSRAMLDGLDRHKKSGTVIRFADGNHYHIQGPSLSNLQSIGFRYEVQDEVWMWAKGKIGEADGRVGDYLRQQRSKIFRISQGGPPEGVSLVEDDWHRVYTEGTAHDWQVECPACHGYMAPSLGSQRPDGSYWGLEWDKHKLPNGDWHLAKVLPTVRFCCQHCGHPVIDGARTKSEWNRTGRYSVAGDLNPKKKSFHWSALIDYPWDELVELWLNACNAFNRGDPGPKLQFLHKRMAQFKDLESLMRGGAHLTRVEYDVATTWPDERARYLCIDRQEKDMFWWMVRAASTERTRRLGFGKAYSFDELEKLRKEFKVRPERTFCDSRFAPKGDNGVYAACARYGWRAVMGDGQHSEFLHSRYGQNIKRPVMKSYSEGRMVYAEVGKVGPYAGRCVLVFFAKSRLNGKVQDLLDAGRWEEPPAGTGDAKMEEEYSAQMASRFRRTEFSQKTNEVRVYWWEGKNDHARDLSNQCVLGMMIDGLTTDPATEILTRGEAKKEEVGSVS